MIDKLELLLALAKERHFGRAAEACGVTQPTMSTSLKQLEEILGVMLVQRGSRFQGFTPEGERTLDWARRIVGDARAMRHELDALRHGLTGRLRIAAIPTTLAMVASLTTPFRMRHPNVQFTILSRTSIEVLADPIEFATVRAVLTHHGFAPASAEVTRRAATSLELSGDDAEAMVQLLEALEGLEDVRDVYSNVEISDEVLARL